jgi:hypothetical protein
MRRLALSLLVLAALVPVASAHAAPTRNVHSMDWFVHIDLIDAGAGMDLAFFQALIADRLREADRLVQGHQGPVDNGCCVELDPVTVTTFGTPGDGIDVITTDIELDVVLGGGAAAGAYLVESVWYCNSFSMAIRGCAISPGTNLVVGLEADDNQFLPAAMAHERGHNAGLGHVTANPCELMAASSGGGCLSVSECNAFIADADGTSGTCECLDDTLGGPPVSVGTACTDPIGGGAGICNGGGCGPSTGPAGSRLLASGGTGAAFGNSPSTLLEMSTLTGDWDSTGAFGAEIGGLAYDEANDVLYGIEARAGDDALVIIDEATGTVTSTVGVLTGRAKVIALAFDPQPAGDRLFAIENDDVIFGMLCIDIPTIPPGGIPGDCSSELFEIDPTTAAQTNLGELNALLITDGVQGLAWDDANNVLYAATPAGLDTVDLASCTGSSCGNTPLDGVFYDPVSLAYDGVSGRVVRVGHNGFGVTREDVFDPTGSETQHVRGLDVFTVGGLAAKAVPEPGTVLGLSAGMLTLAALRRRKRA